MVPGRAAGLNRTSCAIVLIGQNPLLRKRIAFVLRGAGFRIAASVPDADLAFLRTVPREHQIVSIFDTNTSFDETSRHLKHFRTLYPTGSVVLAAGGDLRHRQPKTAFGTAPYLVSAATDLTLAGAAWPVPLILVCGTHTNLPRACEWFGEAVKSRYLTPEKRRRSARAGKGDAGIPENAASSGAVTPATTAGERSLTARQAMIVKSLMNGDSNKAVARKLRIAEETVKVHVKRLLRRIGVKNRTQVAIWALNNNFTPAPAGKTEDLPLAAPKTEFGGPPGCSADRAAGRRKGQAGPFRSAKWSNITKP
jgi:two-component system nitrate/nitrite response regulator NarL